MTRTRQLTPLRWHLNALVQSACDQWDGLVDLDLAFPPCSMETNAVPRLSYEGLHMLRSGQTNLVYQIIYRTAGVLESSN